MLDNSVVREGRRMFGRDCVTVFIPLCNRTVGLEKKKKKRVVVAPGEGWREGRRGVETLSLTRRGFSPRCSGTDGRATGYVGNASHASPFSHSTTTICCHREIARPLNFLRLSVGS